jgi:hypothetical protein
VAFSIGESVAALEENPISFRKEDYSVESTAFQAMQLSVDRVDRRWPVGYGGRERHPAGARGDRQRAGKSEAGADVPGRNGRPHQSPHV